MDIEDLKKHQVEDKGRVLELQKEMVDSFKEYFGDYEVVVETAEELEKKFNDFMQWRNKSWIVPGEGKTPEQLWKENGNPPIEFEKIKLKNKFDKNMRKFGLIADPIFGLSFVPFYGYLKEYFEGDRKKIPEYLDFFYNIVSESDWAIPSFVIKKMILKDTEKAIKIFKEGYKDVKDIEDVYNILKKYRKDWDESPGIWHSVIDSEKAGTIKSSKNNISKEGLDEMEFSMKEFEASWQEYFKDKPNPTNDDEERKEQEEFHYWYNNVRKQSDTGKTPVEMGKRIMNFERDEDYVEDDFSDLESDKKASIHDVKPWEVALIDKILLLSRLSFPDEEEKAMEMFEKVCSEEISIAASEEDIFRGFQAWFLLEYRLPNGKTPMENAFSRDDSKKLFSKREIKMITNFLAFTQSLFEIKNISENKKDYTIENVTDNRTYLVKTIDFPAKLKLGEFIIADIVEKISGDYFFYGNVSSFKRKDGLKIKEDFIKEYNRLKKKA